VRLEEPEPKRVGPWLGPGNVPCGVKSTVGGAPGSPRNGHGKGHVRDGACPVNGHHWGRTLGRGEDLSQNVAAGINQVHAPRHAFGSVRVVVARPKDAEVEGVAACAHDDRLGGGATGLRPALGGEHGREKKEQSKGCP